VHVLYGGAHLFRQGMTRRAGEVALKALDEHGYPLPLPAGVEEALREKLRREPVEDFRIDFEDGYGVRSEADEDGHAREAAMIVVTALDLPPRSGIRVKALSGATEARSRRTLEIFFEGAVRRLPQDFVVTLPKITSPEEVSQLAEFLRPFPTVRIELMIETPQAMRSIPQLVYACEGRCAGIHFGAYDYLSSVGMAAAGQSLRHPACDFARFTMQMHSADLGVPVADGVTNLIPAGETRHVHAAWKAHADAVRHALHCGFYQGWDIHPAQLVSRFASVYSFFAEQAEPAGRRLKNFMERQQQATRVGVQFDDAATVAGLRNFFERAIGCGAMSKSRVEEMTCDIF
jgi:citrate lyase beta subunit